MTQPEEAPAFLGFANQPVPVPPRWVLEYDPLAGQYGETGDYFAEIGQSHADTVVNNVITMRRNPDFRPYELDTEVERFHPHPEDHYGGEFDDNARDYTNGLLVGIADKAEMLEYLQSTSLSDHTEFLAQDVEWYRTTVGDLPADEVNAVVTQLDNLVRELARTSGATLPQRMIIADERQAQETQDRAALEALSTAIDRYALHQALPALHSPSNAEQRAEHNRLIARIAVLDTQTPHILPSLPADRARIVHNLLPESSTRERDWRWPSPLPEPPAPNEVALRSLTNTTDELLAALLHPAAGPDHPAVQPLATQIARLRAEHPELVAQLPPVHAGLIRDLDAVRAHTEDSNRFPTAGTAALEQPQRQAPEDPLDPFMLAARASRFTFDANTVPVEDPQYRPWLVLHVERRGSTQWIIRRGGADGDVFNPDTGEFDSNWAVGHTGDPTRYRFDRDDAVRRAADLLAQATSNDTSVTAAPADGLHTVDTASAQQGQTSQTQRTPRPPVPARPGTAAARHSAAARSPGTARGR